MRYLKIALIVFVALWGILGGTANLGGYQAGYQQVADVLAREGTLGPTGPFLAFSHPAFIHLGLSTIWLGKLISGALCLLGAWRMWVARSASAETFDAAKTVALAGCGVAILMLFGSFVTIGGVYFFMWQSETGQLSQQFAWGYISSIGMVALFVNMTDTRSTDT